MQPTFSGRARGTAEIDRRRPKMQPTFSGRARGRRKNYWISDSSAVSGIKIRMHARRTRNRRIHYWPNRPLRPIGGDNAGIAAAVVERKVREWRGAPCRGPKMRQLFSVEREGSR